MPYQHPRRMKCPRCGRTVALHNKTGTLAPHSSHKDSPWRTCLGSGLKPATTGTASPPR